MVIRKLPRRMRWAVPAAALIATGGVIAGFQMPVAQASPSLPARTAAQLLTDVATAKAPAMSGTVVETAALGLPELSGNSASITSLLAGTHTLQVWYAGQQDFRISLPGRMSEIDLYRDGSTEYLWQSAQNTVTKFIGVPAKPAGFAGVPSLPVALTPQEAANDVLAAVGPTTAVGTESNVYVAGQAAYQLVLAPKASGSTISNVSIAIDASNGVPLRVQVFGQNAGSPAISVGFSTVAFAAPARGAVSYNRPAGARVSVVNLAEQGQGALPDGITMANGKLTANPLPPGSPLAEVHPYGTGWTTVIEVPASALDSTSLYASGALQPLLNTELQVHGKWGSGQLLTSGLLNALITSNTVYVGAVEPSVLYAAAAASR
jgi:hypothetical protein